MPLKKLALYLVLSPLALGIASFDPPDCRAESVKAKETEVGQHIQRLGSKSDVSVIWVGHSLVESKVESSWGRVDLMTLVGRLAESRKLTYAMTDHTLFGSPLSALWRGQPHSYSRDASEMIAKRETFERNASRYDTLVLTEAIPLAGTLKHEFGPYYLRRFACTLTTANPAARVYLYQTWVHFQGSHRSATGSSTASFDWRAEMMAEAALWEQLAAAAEQPAVDAPNWLHKLGWRSQSDGGCASVIPIYRVPVGNALVALNERLLAPKPDDHFTWPDGTPFQLTDMVANPTKPGGALRDPSRPADDIHPSVAGVYLSAVVHFSTLYRQSPIGLPYPAEIGEKLARTMHCIAWETVLSDQRSGVSGTPAC